MYGTLILDLDGTVADTRHRAHLIKPGMKEHDWRAYSMECAGDKAVDGVIETVRLLAFDHVVIVSGRHEDARRMTERWLARRVAHDELVMRAAGDVRPNVAYKLDAVTRMRGRGDDLKLAIDDYPAVAQAFERIKLPCLLVARDGAGR